MTQAQDRQLALQTILYQALAEPVGLLLHSGDPARARQMLYQARAKLNDPDLAHMQIRLCEVAPRAEAEGGNLAIVKGEKLPQAESYAPSEVPGPSLKGKATLKEFDL